MKAIRSELHELTSRKKLDEGLEAILQQLTPVIRGWRNYFQIGNSTKKLQELDRYVQQRLRRLVRAMRGSRGHWKEKVFTAWINESSLAYFYRPARCGA